MRSAAEILKDYGYRGFQPELTKAINEARRDAIEECANQIISNNPISAKERILSLIDELK